MKVYEKRQVIDGIAGAFVLFLTIGTFAFLLCLIS